MSIDTQLGELITALNRVADSNQALAAAYNNMAAAPDNGPKRSTKPAAQVPTALAPELPGEPLPPAAPPAAPPPVQEAPVATGPTFQDVRAALVPLDRTRVTAILAKFGCTKLSDLKPEQYADALAEAKAPAPAAPSQDPLL